jgi:hypothetical protein
MDDPANATLVWTSRALLHNEIDLKKAAVAGLRREPGLKEVIKHLRNLVDLMPAFQEKFFASDWDLVLTTILSFLSKRMKGSPKLLRELEVLEFVQVRPKLFVRPSRLCFDLQQDLENEQYFKVPKILRPFKTLLALLGAETGLGEQIIVEMPLVTEEEDAQFARNMLAKLSKTFDDKDSFADVEFKVFLYLLDS